MHTPRLIVPSWSRLMITSRAQNRPAAQLKCDRNDCELWRSHNNMERIHSVASILSSPTRSHLGFWLYSLPLGHRARGPVRHMQLIAIRLLSEIKNSIVPYIIENYASVRVWFHGLFVYVHVSVMPAMCRRIALVWLKRCSSVASEKTTGAYSDGAFVFEKIPNFKL